MNDMEIKFIGAAREVTGSKHLITTRHGKKILLDCGMFQGKGLETDSLNRNTMVDPAEIDHYHRNMPLIEYLQLHDRTAIHK